MNTGYVTFHIDWIDLIIPYTITFWLYVVFVFDSQHILRKVLAYVCLRMRSICILALPINLIELNLFYCPFILE